MLCNNTKIIVSPGARKTTCPWPVIGYQLQGSFPYPELSQN